MCYTVSMQRIVVYVPQELHIRLKASLSSKGQTISSWFRLAMKKELGEEPKKTNPFEGAKMDFVSTQKSKMTPEEYAKLTGVERL